MHYTWLGNGYAWDFFLVPACVSLGCLLLTGCMFALMKDVKPIANLLEKWGIDPDYPSWGIKSVANHPQLYEDGHAKRFGAKTEEDVVENGFASAKIESKSSDDDSSL